MKAAERRQLRREKRQRWKAVKKQDRAELKAHYADAPRLVRFWNIYAKKPVKTLFYAALIASVLAAIVPGIFTAFFTELLNAFYEQRNEPVSKEQIYALSPIDEEGAARIDALPPVDADDTWTLCVYMVGADLEDADENDLSYLTRVQIQEKRAALAAENNAEMLQNLAQFTEELNQNGLDMPSYFYYPVQPVASSKIVTEDVVVAERLGAASVDIAEMTSELWSDNIRIVIQTGGATHWTNQLVNPNRTQRFLFENGQFKEIANLPLQPSSEPETLADFLRFCSENYRSDHMFLDLWNHGGGAFGYGSDSIYGGMFTLRDIRAALESVFEPSSTDPAFDIIGFDACLMSSLEVTHALDGFADYYVLSEELEPGEGWDYAALLRAMTEDPSMSPARVGRTLADAYMDYYMTQNVNLQDILSYNVAFSVLDARKCSELYDAYCELAEAQLIRAAEDISVLAEIGRCANRATHFDSAAYDIINTLDLANYVDYMVDSFPEESSRVKELVGEAVLYHRENGSLSDVEGISVYLPATVKTFSGMQYFLDYINDVVDDDSIRALYYYKVAGCLNDELLAHVATLTDVKPRVLNTDPFRAFSNHEPVMEEDAFSIPVGEELQTMLQDYAMEVYAYDEEKVTVTSYGIDDIVTLDGEGNAVGSFDGKWFYLDDVPLAVEVASSSASSVEYRSKVLYNGSEAYLIFSFDRDTDAFTLSCVREIPDPSEDVINYLANTRSRLELEEGSKITPLYMVQNFRTNERSEERGDTVKLRASSAVTRKALPNGVYLGTVYITDQRGEEYYSAVVSHTVSGGRVTGRAVNPDFYGSAY